MWVRPLNHWHMNLYPSNESVEMRTLIYLCRCVRSALEEKGRLAKCSGAYLHTQSSVCWEPGILKEQWTGKSQ